MEKLVKTGWLLDGTGSKPLEKGCFLVKDNLIVKTGVYRELESEINNQVEIIDLSDYYVLPGLIDSHTHLSIVPGEGNQLAQMRMPATSNIIRSIPNIYKNLKSGVTTMRIMGEEY